MKGRLWTKGRRYTIGGKIVHPRDFVGRDAFKFVNHIATWARGEGGGALGNARKWIENRNLENGITVLRAPPEVDLWDSGYWMEPENQTGIVLLTAKPGSRFKLSSLQKKIIRKYVLLGREYEIWFQIPWCWTIKHSAESFQDPRGNDYECSIWNEHYLAAVGKYIAQLREEGDGEKNSRVDPGYIPFLSEAANEYHTLGPNKWDRTQLMNIFSRWHTRDTVDNNGAKPEVLGVSQGGPIKWDDGIKPEPYVPRLDKGLASPDDIQIHPPRDIEIPWWNIGSYVEQADYPTKPVYVNETTLLAETKVLNKYPKWKGKQAPDGTFHGLGTNDFKHYFEMCDDLLNRGYYLVIHDFDGMGAGWGESLARNKVDDAIKEFMNVPTPPPEWEKAEIRGRIDIDGVPSNVAGTIEYKE